MARKLKTFQTSLGFFDLAIAAPSMKAALEAWGADSNLFHQGVAKEANDADVVAATMAVPGVVLKRPVGSSGPFKERAELPTDIAGKRTSGKNTRNKPEPEKSKQTGRPAVAGRKAAAAYAKEGDHRRREREKEEAALQKALERRRRAVEKAQGALDAAREKHDGKAAEIRAEIEALEERLRAEDARWSKEKSRLDDLLRRARK